MNLNTHENKRYLFGYFTIQKIIIIHNYDTFIYICIIQHIMIVKLQNLRDKYNIAEYNVLLI